MRPWSGRYAQRILAVVLRRDGYRCAWCGGVATSADHVIARHNGGTDDLGNLVASCLPCNQSKGTGSRPRRRVDAPPSRPW